MNSAVLEKLKKILALGSKGRGATEAEMQAAMAKAQQLAIEHNIDLGSIKLDDDKATPIETDVVGIASEESKYVRPHHWPLIYALRMCFQVEFIWTDGKQASGTFVGEKVDVMMAVQCFKWLDPLFPKLHRQYCNNLGVSHTPEDTSVLRRSYYEGLRDGIIESNRRAVKDLARDKADQYALVLVKKEEVVKARYKEEFPDATPLKTRARQHDSDAHGAGRDKGRNIKLNAAIDGPQSPNQLL